AAQPAAQPAQPAAVQPAKPAAVTEADCEAHKARKAMLDATTAAKGKVEHVKMDTGVMTVMTVDAKKMAGLDKAAGEMGAVMKKAHDGSAKLCDECHGTMAAMKSGKAMNGVAKLSNGYATVMLTADSEMVKALHAKAEPAAKK
ncbi:MAG: hypothetical protein AB2A00_31910, partial [Myxococcota bacterium]